MARYIFSGGKVTVEEGLYMPVLRSEKRSSRGILILAKSVLQTTESAESTQEKEQQNVQEH